MVNSLYFISLRYGTVGMFELLRMKKMAIFSVPGINWITYRIYAINA